jgi:glycosyltransferase involved in cell wall biosynthesis
VRTRPGATHVCYCHTPARWLWDPAAYTTSVRDRMVLEPALRRLRRWDRRAATRPTAYIANSARTARAIERVYGLLAPVIPPPVRLDGLDPTPGGERLLVVSRLLPYKRVDLAVEAANRSGLPLDVVGVGPELAALRARAKANVVFHGAVDDRKLKALLEGCRMLLLPGVEDFGITPIEANAAGKPVVAFGAGGVLESQVEGVSAVFFGQPTADALLDAIERVGLLTSTPAQRRANAERFGPDAFAARLHGEIARVLRGESLLPSAAQKFTREPAPATAAYAASMAST